MSIIDPHLLHGLHITRMRHAGAVRPPSGLDALFQTSTLEALLDGAYDGDVSFRELARHGDFGIGTLQGLDGEMIALDGSFFVARADGTVSGVPPDALTPFAVVVPWGTDGSCSLAPSSSLAALVGGIDRCAGTEVEMLAVRVEGRFGRVVARSVARQTPPYRPLAEVTKSQSEAVLRRIEGR